MHKKHILSMSIAKWPSSRAGGNFLPQVFVYSSQESKKARLRLVYELEAGLDKYTGGGLPVPAPSARLGGLAILLALKL